MTPRSDSFTDRVEAWLEIAPGEETPDAVLDRIVGSLDATPQQRRSGKLDSNAVLGFALGAAATLILAIIGIQLIGERGAGNTDPGVGASPSTQAVDDLGVFEPVRGQIVFPVGDHLEAVDPDGTSPPHVIEPGDLGLDSRAMPAGWSADGSKLAITDEYNGDQYVMDGTGSLTRVPTEELPGLLGGCCGFVTNPWLSPDGAKGLAFGQGRLYVLDLQDLVASRSIPLDRDGYPGAWSPDGSQAAWIQSATDGDVSYSTGIISITDLASGRSRVLTELTGMYIRHITWSPDGSQLLVIAGEDDLPWGASLNPLVLPQPTNLYVVEIGDGEPRVISSGHYVAAAWSPDGTRIAAIDYSQATGRQVVVLRADGSGDRRVVADLRRAALFTGVVWHPAPVR